MGHIIGCFDGFAAGSVLGWIANTTHPEKLERVVFRGANGASVTVLAFLPRLDVCDALNLRGRFGFAVPISALQSLDPVIDVTDAYGAVLQQGAAVQLPSLGVASEPDAPRHVVLHIPKTGGTSLRLALMAAFRPGEALAIYPGDQFGLAVGELDEVPPVQRQMFRMMMGHTSFGIAEYLPGTVEYVTILRHPEARLRSNYRHHLSDRPLFPVGGVHYPISIVVQRGLAEEFDNLMTRVLAGVSTEAVPLGSISARDVDRALHNIRTRFQFIGLAERLQEHYPALCRILHIPEGVLGTENVTRLRQQRERPGLGGLERSHAAQPLRRHAL